MDKIGYYLKQVGFNFIYIILITLIAQIMGTIGWIYSFQRKLKKISFYKIFSIRTIGDYVGIINPSSIIGGDGLKSYLLHKEGIKTAESISSLLITRAVMIITQVGMFILAAIIYSLFVSPSHQLGRITLLSIGMLAMLYILVRYLFSSGGLGWIFKIVGQQKLESIQSIFQNIRSYYQQSPRRIYLSSLFSSLNWIIGSIEIFLIFYFLGVDISLIGALLVDQGVLVLKSFGAFIPGQVGVEEYANKIMFSIVGIVSLEIWLAASVLRRARQLFWIGISGILYLSIKKEAARTLNFHSS